MTKISRSKTGLVIYSFEFGIYLIIEICLLVLHYYRSKMNAKDFQKKYAYSN